jgi:hypothetical protein
MSSLYLLALLLTGNDDKAERCFISALDAAIEVDLLLEGLAVLVRFKCQNGLTDVLHQEVC